MILPRLSSITIYPIKSLDGMQLEEAVISEGGCILHDREFAIVGESGKRINGKRNPLVHKLRSTVNFDNYTFSFLSPEDQEWQTFSIHDDHALIVHYLSEYFHQKVTLSQDHTGRFLDEPDISGATLVSTSSLQTIADKFELTLPETRKRFRATLEISGVPAFWEDQLFAGKDEEIAFTIGDVQFSGMGPRARCVVPTRNPENAEVTHGFAKTFSELRANELPEWSQLDEYDYYYYLTVDCMIPSSEVGKIIRTGDQLIFNK